jgi:hypothetical protein
MSLEKLEKLDKPVHGARELLELLKLEELEELDAPSEPEWMKITQKEYYERYKERVKSFYLYSIASHDHNSFHEDHMSTLSEFGYNTLGKRIVSELEQLSTSEDEKFTLVEIGAGTGICAENLCEGMIEKGNKKIKKYIYTDPFNSLHKPTKHFPNLSIQTAQTDIIGAISGIQKDDSIQNAILLVCCPPPIHENRYGDRDHPSYNMVSTDVIALVESVNCKKIKYVMIVRYNQKGRTELDGTIDFYDYHVPLLKKFEKWYIHNTQSVIQYYGNSYGDEFYRTLNIFSRKPVV